jgi:hypothetical protein
VGLRAGLESAENFAHTEIRSTDRPARRKSLYRLSYRGRHRFNLIFSQFLNVRNSDFVVSFPNNQNIVVSSHSTRPLNSHHLLMWR